VPERTAEKSKTVPWSAGFVLADGCKTHCLRFRYLANLFLYVFFWVIPWRLNFICQRFGTLCLFYLHTYRPMKVEQTECSEMSVHKMQTPENYPEESIKHSEHGESLKSRNLSFTFIQ
jgi:hypothetical protein